ncbi:bifunctional diaminohydroxyphosphoribosylaminopyrimidine deaminase/5-amino-6-(5-phosphoribosylamino)uracil reductase RibD [Frigoriflavimonas asaccharolytica]|uniref:Riboflavin biosynthesis protein RibD n=1 Tax=Frigoriflavimonas asaccharolytica TaxID=2735899 RepID=A0A8J8GB63_9FLAO|nr:bifunctional diaminohydroxyphosphoribosylaminopyrimidine deaminase/5-amino-6-(5-phosphoribosylamino)uracil reductase RibD [Frigoriflavimonas asaccharolytica]NRS92452.1 diaminohydroxyphosphoribosylaminopyrimidine deaminase/5-amino-6-(5-phosphoribosylamino)uracil reductase [Frigoriflavimonas asaccharolytica]
MKEEDIYIGRCIQLAKKALGNTYPNPLVGAVIIHDGKIIGEGYHKKAGEPHAEINAINSVEVLSLLPESTIYVSLEPCAHFGKTPPCALKLKEIGFKKVVIGCRDSHGKVDGKGIEILKNAGIEVQSGILEKECRDLNKRFFCFHEKKRPYIILKWAQSADGFLDKDFLPTAIGNSLTKQFVHQLRSEEHAILVGTNTAIVDNPSLTTREIEGRNPTRILLDFDLKVSKDSEIFNNEAPTLVFNQIKNEEIGNLKFIKIEKENLLQNLLQKLYEEQIQSVIIEGGSYTLQKFINENLWDETIIIKNNELLVENGTKAPTFEGKLQYSKKFLDCDIEFYKNY